MGAKERPGLEFRHPELLGCRALCTLGDALCAQEALNAAMLAPDQAGLAVRVAWRVAVDQYLKPQTPVALAFRALRRWRECCDAVASLLADVPMGWRLAARMLPPLAEDSRVAMVPSVEEVSALLVARLGWRWAGGLPVPLAGLSVKLGTVMQFDMVVAARHVSFHTGGALTPVSYRRRWESLTWMFHSQRGSFLACGVFFHVFGPCCGGRMSIRRLGGG